MTDPIPEEAVEAAAIARWDFVRAGIPDDMTWDMRQPHARRFDTDCMRAALTAAAPHIAAQATADLRAGIEALRDEWRATGLSSKEHRMSRFTYTECADELDALLRERAR